MPLEVRVAAPAEYAAIGELCVAAYTAIDQLEHEDYAATLRDAAGRAAAACLLVAVADGVVLGTVTVVLDGGPLAEITRPGEGGFRMLAVDPAAARAGVGQALVQDVLMRATGAGLTRVVCSTRPGMLGAQRLYERLGFIREPERDWSPLPGLALYVYARDL